VRAVRDGHCEPQDALRHSATGTAELVTIVHGRAVPDRCFLGAHVAKLLPASPDRPAALTS
jgi:hypothetical protein